uniref:Fas-associating death domain-containing protein n=1 Tax=Molgula tectiformis TaxID=30286 RepID=A0N085_MOLTE|nr:Fas-associating death domain-containing protein [Molgula tectiformis]
MASSHSVLKKEREIEGKFKQLLNHLSKNDFDIESLKYQCADHIKPAHMERITSSLQLFTALHERDVINPENLAFLTNIFDTFDRVDLTQTIQQYHSSVKQLMSPIQPYSGRTFEEPTQNNKADAFVHDEDLARCVQHVSRRITSNWKSLARYLNIPEDEIEVNVENNPRNVREAIRQTMSWWESNGRNVSKASLIAALREIGRNDLGDDLQYNQY